MVIPVNLVAIVLAGVARMVLGYAWYAPSIFGKEWMKLVGLTEAKLKKAQKEMGPYFALDFVVGLGTAYLLSHVAYMSSEVMQTAFQFASLSTAFFMWLGFVAPVQLTRVVYSQESWRLFLINTGYQLCALILMGLIIGMM